MSGRVQTMTLPNGKFLLIFDCMPHLELGSSAYLEDWAPARAALLETTGAACVLRFDHCVDVVAPTARDGGHELA